MANAARSVMKARNLLTQRFYNCRFVEGRSAD
jgi:hypothetical protein